MAGDETLFVILMLLPLVLLVLLLIASHLAEGDGKHHRFFSSSKAILKRSFIGFIITYIVLYLGAALALNIALSPMFANEKIDGFSDYFLRELQYEYDLAIPDSAQFVEGLHAHAFRDSSIKLTFSVPKEDFYNMFVDNWTNDGPGISEPVTPPGEDEGDFLLEGSFYYAKKEFVSFTYKETEPGLIVCKLDGPNISSEPFVSDWQGG